MHGDLFGFGNYDKFGSMIMIDLVTFFTDTEQLLNELIDFPDEVN